MGGYIRIDKDQAADRRLFDLADRLAETWHVTAVNGHGGEDLSSNDTRHALRNALLGALVTLWVYADTHIESDNSLRVTLSGLAPIVGLPVEILRALPDNWLRVRSDGYVELPGYCLKNNVRARDLRHTDLNAQRQDHKRELAAERQRRHRQKVKTNVTRKPSRSRHDLVTTTGTGTGPLDLTGTVPGGAPLAANPERAAAARSEREPEREPGPMTEAQLTLAVRTARDTLHWSDDKILRKYAKHGMTQAHLDGLPRPGAKPS